MPGMSSKTNKWPRQLETNIGKIVRYTSNPVSSDHNSCRQNEVKLSRLRVGHTRLTYGHLMSNNAQPTCRNLKLTIKYCLIKCP